MELPLKETVASTSAVLPSTCRTVPITEMIRPLVPWFALQLIGYTVMPLCAAAHNGITVYPISWSANQGTSGRIISVIGTVRQVDGNTALVDATVSFSGSSIPQTIPAVQMDSTRNLEHYEGMVVVATGLYSASGGPAPCTGRVAPCNQSWQLCYVGTAGHSTYLRQYFGVIEGVGSGHVFRRFDTQSYGSGYVECD